MEHESPGYDARPTETVTTGQDEMGQGPDAAMPAEARLSRRNAWLAMGAVALALGLIWMAPGLCATRTSTPPPARRTIRANPATPPPRGRPHRCTSP